MRNVHYGWVMVVICMGVLAARSLPLQTFGVFLKPLTAEFGWDRGAFSYNWWSINRSSILIIVTN